MFRAKNGALLKTNREHGEHFVRRDKLFFFLFLLIGSNLRRVKAPQSSTSILWLSFSLASQLNSLQWIHCKSHDAFDSLSAVESIRSRFVFLPRDGLGSRRSTPRYPSTYPSASAAFWPQEPHRDGEHTRVPFKSDPKHCACERTPCGSPVAAVAA